MSKTQTKQANSMYYDARKEASELNDAFSSREKSSELLGIDRTRLARIELGQISPYPEEVKIMAEAYNCPELCNSYCANECSIGKGSVKEVHIDDFDRMSLKVLASLKDVNALRDSLIAISEDGVIDVTEKEEFDRILDSLDKIATTAQALRIWAKKNVRFKNID